LEELYFIYLLNLYIIEVSNGFVSDSTTPVFDLDDGFLPNTFGFAENIANDCNIPFKK
jgi:hypothetical protein